MKTLITYPLYCLIGLAILSSCTKKGKEAKEEGVSTVLPDQVNEVKVMVLLPSEFSHELISNGVVSAASKADLRFQTQEDVAEIMVKNGERVAKGQRIASLNRFRLQNNFELAKDNLERSYLMLQDLLIGQGYTLKDTALVPDDMMKAIKVKSNYDQNRIQFGLAEYNLKNAVLNAPFAGVVANLFTKPHNIPDPAHSFCTIIDDRLPELEFTILESELSLIKTGDKVMVSPFAIQDYVTEGRVSEINPVVDRSGMVRIRATLNNAQGKLYDGMNVKVRVQRAMGKQLVIPKEALVLRTNRKVVFTLKGGLAHWVYVGTSLENSTSYVVISGLAAGDSIIYEGNVNLADETPVLVIEE